MLTLGLCDESHIRFTAKGRNMANEYLIDIHTGRLLLLDALSMEWQQMRAYLAEKVDLKTQKYF